MKNVGATIKPRLRGRAVPTLLQGEMDTLLGACSPRYSTKLIWRDGHGTRKESALGCITANKTWLRDTNVSMSKGEKSSQRWMG